jgi:release factor glutamine methyltransferase
MHSQNKRVYFGNYTFFVDENVYEPAEDSFFFAENLSVEAGAQVLEIGTGCGLLSVLSAKNAGIVVASDVNPHAVRCAMANAILNRVSGKIAFLQGDLFNALSETSKFDLIIFNSPYLPVDESEANSWLSRAWAGGPTGRKIIDRFILEAPKYLKQSGRILLMQSTLTGVEETIERFSELCLHARVLSERALPFFETIVLIEAKV